MNLQEKIREILVTKFEVPREKLRAEARLVEDFGLDSLDFIAMVVYAEKEIGTKLDRTGLKELRTLGDLEAAFERLAQSK